MRNHHSLTALGSALALLAVSAVAQAQSGYAAYDEFGQPGTGFNASESSGRAVIVDGYADPTMAAPPGHPGYAPGPGYPGVPGAMFQAPYGNNHPATIYPPQVPPTMAPWPSVSPFENPQVGTTQHRIEDGLWFREMLWKKREIEGSIEYIHTQYREPNDTLIGSRYGRILPNSGGGTGTGSTATSTGVFGPSGPPIATYSLGATVPLNSIMTGPGAYPIPGLWQAPAIVFTLDSRNFPFYPADVLGGGLDSNGVRLRFGVMDEDDQGWRVSGHYAPEANLNFERGRAKIANQRIDQSILLQNPNLIFTKNGAIPLIDAINPADSAIGIPTFNGTTQKYDVLFRLDYDTTSAGGELNRFLGTVYKTPTVRVSSFIGGRYFYLREHFGFRGIDSGFGYEIDYDLGDEDGTSTYRPVPNSIDVAYPLLDARLNSNVKSHMAGPQIGFRFDIGKKESRFKLWGQSTFGLLANHEQLEVHGNNIGDPLFHPEMYNLLTNEYLDNSFNDGESHTHVSPLLEQSLYADIKLANLVPVLKRNYYLEDATLRVGWTWTYIGEVSRPADSIDWKGFPLTPSVRIDRKNFTMNTLSVGIECPF